MRKQNLFPFRVDWINNQILIQNLLYFFSKLKKKEFLFMNIYWYTPANVNLLGHIEHN